MALLSPPEEVTLARVAEKGNPSKGSHISREKGSKTLLRLPPKKLGMRDIVVVILISSGFDENFFAERIFSSNELFLMLREKCESCI